MEFDDSELRGPGHGRHRQGHKQRRSPARASEQTARSGAPTFGGGECSHNAKGLNIPGWRLEKLKGDREGQYSIRINQRYRICFDWSGRDALNVEIVDYH